MRLDELVTEEKIILRSMIDLTCKAEIIHSALKKGRYGRLSELTIGQINILIGDTVDYDTDFDDELDLDFAFED
jgi:hypothetical protein